MGFEAVALNEKLPSPYLDKYEPQKGRADYMFICSPKKWRTEIHYSEVLSKSFHCFGGLCCKVIPKKTPYTIYLIAQYLDGRNAKSGLILKFLRAGRQVDEAIRSLADQFEDPSQLTKVDLKVELDTSKPEQFKNLKITPCLDGKRMAGKEALLDIKEQIKAFMPNLEASVANIISEEEFIKLCEEKDIDVTQFSEDVSVMKSEDKKTSTLDTSGDEEVEEPEEIEVEEKPASKKVPAKKAKTEEVEETPDSESVEDDSAEPVFDLDDLL